MSRINPDSRVVAEAEARVYIRGQGTGPVPGSSPEKSSIAGGVDTDGTFKGAGITGITSTADGFYTAG